MAAAVAVSVCGVPDSAPDLGVAQAIRALHTAAAAIRVGMPIGFMT